MKIAGIDPGTRIVGYFVLDCERRRIRTVAYGTIQPRRRAIHLRLQEILAALDTLFQLHRPEHVALERAFVGRNSAAALRLAEGRGVALACAGKVNAKLFEYTALEAKRAVSTQSRASKSSIQRSVQLLLGLKTPPESDSADAAALALCHASRHLGW